jgi:hypothetical protein
MPVSGSSYDLTNMVKFLKEIDSKLLIDLLAYLKIHNYNNDIVMYFFEIIDDICFYDSNHCKFDVIIEDKENYIRNIINILNDIGKINFVRDINKDKYFLDNLIATNKKGIGYKINDQGNVVISKDKPTYTIKNNVYTIMEDKQINILFDEVTKNNELFKSKFIYELFLMGHMNFRFYWYVANREMLINMLIKGNAIRESRRVASSEMCLPTIPFSYNKEQFRFEILKDNDDMESSIYLYLYYKLEYLLGSKYMKDWLNGKGSISYLYKTKTLLNEKYGNRTFERLYTYIQLILYFYKNKSKDEIMNEIDNNLSEIGKLEIYRNPPYHINNIRGTELVVSNILSDLKNIKISYELDKEEYEKNTKKMVLVGSLQTDEIKPFISEESYREELEINYFNLRKIEQVLENEDMFDCITYLDSSIYETVKNNQNDITKNIIKLEAFMLECMKREKDLCSNRNLSIARISNYRKNVMNCKFNIPILIGIKNKVLDIKNNFNIENEEFIRMLRKQI